MSNYNNAPNRYGAFCAEIYDLDKPTGSLNDIGYYVERLKTIEGPILDPAAGTGRMFIPLMEAGLDMVGFDRSPDMLSVLRKHAAARGLEPKVTMASWQDFRFDETFGAIILPVGAFILIDDFDEAMAILRRFHAHLKPGGTLFIDIMPLNYLTDNHDGIRTWETPSGEILTVTSRRVAIDHVRQTKLGHDIYQRWRGGQLVETELEVMSYRIWGIREFEMALREAGFSEVRITGNLTGDRMPRRDIRVINYEAVK